MTTNENVKSLKNNNNVSTSTGRCSGYTHQQTFFSSRVCISSLLFLHVSLATKEKHTQSYPKKDSNGKGKKRHHKFFQTGNGTKALKGSLVDAGEPSLVFHCHTSFLLSMFSNVKAIKNIQRIAPFECASVKHSLKAACSRQVG